MVFWKSLVSFNNYHSEREKSIQRFINGEPELLCGPEQDVLVSLHTLWSKSLHSLNHKTMWINLTNPVNNCILYMII